METFAPSVMVNGRTVEPPGWMWVLGFALRGCDWALRECETERFKTAARTWMKERDDHNRAGMIRMYEKKLAELRAELSDAQPSVGRGVHA